MLLYVTVIRLTFYELTTIIAFPGNHSMISNVQEKKNTLTFTFLHLCIFLNSIVTIEEYTCSPFLGKKIITILEF